MAYSEPELLARLIQCEAGGEGDNGMKAVACVVMNRVRVDYGEYGRRVIANNSPLLPQAAGGCVCDSYFICRR